MLISVCVCTFRRPGVVDTLGSIVRQDLPLGVELEIVVVDNDCAASAAQAVQGFADGAPVPVRYAVEPVQNIATARNRAIDLARGEWIALVDDDECADPSWLVSLLAAALGYDAEIAVGPVVAIYPPATAPWLAATDPLSRNWGRTGTFRVTGSTANALLHRPALAAAGQCFDPAFGRSGGEDTDFFARLHSCGLKIVVAAEAIVRERVPAERLSAGYLRMRALRAGHSYGLIALRPLAPQRRVAFMAMSGVKAGAFALGAMLFLSSWRRVALKLRIRCWLNLGKLRACAGRPLPNLY